MAKKTIKAWAAWSPTKGYDCNRTTRAAARYEAAHNVAIRFRGASDWIPVPCTITIHAKARKANA